MKNTLCLLILILATTLLWAQPGTVGTVPQITTGVSAALPATCVVGQLYFLTSGTVGLNSCNTTNTWSVVGGSVPAGSTITSPSMTPQSIDCHTACSPTAAQLSNAIASNYGQVAANVAITGPTLAAGMNFIMIVGTAQAANSWTYTSTTANIYLDAGASAVTNIIFATPAVGNSFSCFSFQTGASNYSLKCTTLAGTSTSS